tara:strand:+ start:219 stop:911 length:693 start_codon:yes stop_codon:yes gene_type:complete
MLKKNKTLTGDRNWALTYENSRFDSNNPTWHPSQVFLRCSVAPLFAAVDIKTNSLDNTITFSHPMLKSIRLNLEYSADREKFVEWVLPICPKKAPKPSKLCSVPDRGMTDTDYPSISLNSLSSLTDLSKRTGLELSQKRFRGNIWIKNLKPWTELELIGKEVFIGDAILKVVEPIVRCNTTKTNEVTGVRDVDTLSVLQKNFGHKYFGVYCKVVSGANIGINDTFEVLDK